MLNLEELEQLVAFADCGTLSRAAESLHISQPTITRTMQSLEAAFGVGLFMRSKNRIQLNETGEVAVENARALLRNADNVLHAVRAFDKSRNTVLVESCAPAPLWECLPVLSQKFPTKAISSELRALDDIAGDVAAGECDYGILPYPVYREGLLCTELVSEHLSVCLPPDHAALEGGPASLTLADLNGYNCLLRSEIGFWDGLCRRKMPASRFLVQTDDFAFRELVRSSTLPFFITDLGGADLFDPQSRVAVPITDAEANVTYYLVEQANQGPSGR